MNRPDENRSDSGTPGLSDESSFGSSPVSGPNQAFLLAMAAWVAKSGDSSLPNPLELSFREKPQSHLSPTLRFEIEPLLRRLDDSIEGGISPTVAIERLRRVHRAESRPDLDRIHPSWWLRALQEEPPSVRAAIARHGPEPVRKVLNRDSHAPAGNPADDHPIPPEVLSWVLALWSERLVGDLPERDDDPLAIMSLTRLTPRSLDRVLRVTGLVKLTLAGMERDAFHWLKVQPRDEARISTIRQFFEPIDPVIREAARLDLKALDSIKGRLTSSRKLALLGLSTISRLLAACEPYRTRWALQHLPYPIAKRIRNQMPRTSPPAKPLLRLDNLVLTSAWQRLDNEGKIQLSRTRVSTSGDGSPST